MEAGNEPEKLLATFLDFFPILTFLKVWHYGNRKDHVGYVHQENSNKKFLSRLQGTE